MNAEGLAKSMPHLLQAIGAILGYKVGAAWLQDEHGAFLHCSEVCHEVGLDGDAIAAAIRDKIFKSGEGLPGEACVAQRPLWSPDVAAEFSIPLAAEAGTPGKTVGLALPVLTGDRCLGALVFFGADVVKPDDPLMDVLLEVGRQIGESSEQERLRCELEREQLLIRTLMDNLAESIYLKDAQGRFLRNSRAHLESIGIRDRGLAKGRTEFDLTSEQQALQAFEDDQQLLRGGPPIEREEKSIGPDGTVTWHIVQKSQLRDEKGNILGTFGVIHDVTAIKCMQEELQQLKELMARATDKKTGRRTNGEEAAITHT